MRNIIWVVRNIPGIPHQGCLQAETHLWTSNHHFWHSTAPRPCVAIPSAQKYNNNNQNQRALYQENMLTEDERVVFHHQNWKIYTDDDFPVREAPETNFQ